ncbi:TetR/AcrR family transcriptional regulator [Nocardia cyriacigeorgica]|uniref:TetR/AcrR family transcriptional regulator n=1 Tax=Nocardia cyriacigeorgica TaxID=135487 RepID=UPI0018949411|nr:TetR/AcrR family transcriptional regulator [Nocardia cyriacigeorgica]MBF6102117.1 TetR/AcrR family transcriptional regulator [Nocardia cyriacigeorgica]MBF6159116.1 TetR/AcrR family transcriptional regulator [Nocardia cyriacigeorgica]MBF6198199.1 TetR/AcrR family transcriptional regulator [Nocardia cyriacigeorgica]MBF6315479.1 TetR/AcrR family transcriptional regulator [Nocardia cyriacigeorgica]MBF6342990.1 TetR/AcrR family transcriptional regulator [Nocardia cyriacigeorgica]
MTDPATSLRQLPRGRHGLPREQVIASQRERILQAMGEAMVDNGYVGTSVAAILKKAGVSRETFYEQFRSKEDCFEAAYERAVGQLLDRIAEIDAAAADPGDQASIDPVERMRRLFGTYLQHLADDPASARLFLVEVYAVGAKAVARRIELQDLFVERIAEVLDARTPQQRFACRTLAAAVGAMVTGKIATDDLPGLLELGEPLLELVVRGGRLYGQALADG